MAPCMAAADYRDARAPEQAGERSARWRRAACGRGGAMAAPLRSRAGVAQHADSNEREAGFAAADLGPHARADSGRP